MKTQIPNTIKLLFTCFFLILISGCGDQKEVEELAYIIALGIDKSEENEDRIQITYLISNPEAGTTAQGGNSGEPSREIISFEAEDFISSMNLANTVIAKEISYDLLRILVVSEDFARDEKFIRWIYDATKSLEIRRDARLLVSKEETATFLMNNQPVLETRPHEYFNLIFNRGAEVGITPPSELHTFFRITEADADLFLGIYSTSEVNENAPSRRDSEQVKAGDFHYKGETNNVQLAGSAVFKEGKMIDSLTIEETRFSIMLHPILTSKDILATFPDPFNDEYRITARINKDGEVSTKMNLQSATPSIDVSVPILIEVLTNHSMTNYPKDDDKRKKLKESFEQTLEEKYKKLIKKTQEEYGSEPFGWSILARKHFKTIPDWEKFDWMKTYPKMDINVSVHVRLGKFGRQSDLPNLEEVRD